MALGERDVHGLMVQVLAKECVVPEHRLATTSGSKVFCSWGSVTPTSNKMAQRVSGLPTVLKKVRYGKIL